MATAIPFQQFMGGIAVSTVLAMPAVAAEDDYETNADYRGLAVAIDRQLPKSPKDRKRRMQEAWVRLSYVVTPNGRAIDPIVVNSSGGVDFENEVRKVTEDWRFEESVTGEELPYNVVDTRFTIRGKGKGTTRKFARYSRHIMKSLHTGNVEIARKHADETVRIGGWNLYESTILWLMLGRIEGAEGDDVGKLDAYLRALEVGDERSLQRDARLDLLEKIFELQADFGQYAAALNTYERLEAVNGSHLAEKRLAPRVAEVRELFETLDTVVARANIAAPCNCKEGDALWSYVPARRIFSFANINGNVERFEARCERQRISADVVIGRTWSLPDEWGACQVFVFGSDGATFDFLGHARGSVGAGNEEAVAENHVPDSGNPSQ